MTKLIETKAKLPQFVGPPCWSVSPTDFSLFLRQLPNLVPDNSILCLGGVDVPVLEAYLMERPAIYDNKTTRGFLKLRPKIFYMPINKENLEEFITISERYSEPEICNDVSVYWNDRIILSWHDLPTDPFYVAYEIDEAALRMFCEVLGCKYEMFA